MRNIPDNARWSDWDEGGAAVGGPEPPERLWLEEVEVCCPRCGTGYYLDGFAGHVLGMCLQTLPDGQRCDGEIVMREAELVEDYDPETGEVTREWM